MMAKPILVVKTDKAPPDTKRWVDDIKTHLNNEYHVMVLINPIYTESGFEVFNADKIPETTIEVLQQLIKQSWPAHLEPRT